MDFDAYCISKKIDPQLFKHHEPEKYQHWILDFANTNISSFTAQKLYLINNLRRKYHYQAPPILESKKEQNTVERATPIQENTNPEQISDVKDETPKVQPTAKPVMKKPMMKPIIPKQDSKPDEQ